MLHFFEVHIGRLAWPTSSSMDMSSVTEMNFIVQMECPMIVYSSYQTLNVYTKEGQMQERNSLTEFAKKQAA